MKNPNFKAVNISKEDYFALEPSMRTVTSEGPWVLTMIAGHETYVRANIIEPTIW